MSPQGGGGSTPIPFFLAQTYQVPKTLGNGLCTLEILMPDHQLSYLSEFFQGKFNFHDSIYGMDFQFQPPTEVSFGRNGKCSVRRKIDFYINLIFSDDKCPFLYPFRGGFAQRGQCHLFLPVFSYQGFPKKHSSISPIL